MPKARRYFVFFTLLILLTTLFLRLFYIQIIRFEDFKQKAKNQHSKEFTIDPRRGTIFDKYMEPMAINLDAHSIYCNPRQIKEEDKRKIAETLSNILDLDEENVYLKLKKDKGFVWIKRKVGYDTYKIVKDFEIEGIFFELESKRKYPNDNTAAHILGFAGIDNEGLEGLEGYYDDKLKGEAGWRSFIRDARMRTVLLKEEQSMPPRNGYNLILTIDSVVQYIVEEEIKNMTEKFNAEEASIVVMDPVTGKILALANYPTYNLNNYSKSEIGDRKNTAISNVYEPGSVFKIVTASAALNEGMVSLEDTIYCEKGEYRSGGRILHDFHRYGELSFREVIGKSSNIGVVKTAERIGKDKVYEYICKFGFGQKTNIDLPGEVAGISREPSIWSRSDITTIPIGQGIAVTPIQLASAISVIANGGYLMKPYIVDRITTWEGEEIKRFSPIVVRKVINNRTCEYMKDALRYVVTDGTGKRANSTKYEFCGKTGTAQMANPKGGYYDNRYYATFIGFAPKEEPRIAIVVMAKNPHPVYFGGSVGGPTFKKIAERTLEYLESNRWR